MAAMHNGHLKGEKTKRNKTEGRNAKPKTHEMAKRLSMAQISANTQDKRRPATEGPGKKRSNKPSHKNLTRFLKQ